MRHRKTNMGWISLLAWWRYGMERISALQTILGECIRVGSFAVFFVVSLMDTGDLRRYGAHMTSLCSNALGDSASVAISFKQFTTVLASNSEASRLITNDQPDSSTTMKLVYKEENKCHLSAGSVLVRLIDDKMRAQPPAEHDHRTFLKARHTQYGGSSDVANELENAHQSIPHFKQVLRLHTQII